MTTPYVVTEKDREAMVNYHNPSYISLNLDVAAEVLAGKRDDDHRVQAFARHRTEALEEAARVAMGCRLEMNLAPGMLDGAASASRQIAAAIRNLKGQP